MKIALCTHNIVRGDGQGRVAFELANRALRRGYDVTLIADKVEKELLDRGAKWIPVQPRISRPILIKARLFGRMANRVVADHARSFDILHGFGYTLDSAHQINSAQFIHAASRRSPSGPPGHGGYLKAAYQMLFSRCNEHWERLAFLQASKVIACSPQVQKELIAIGVPLESIEVIYNGVDPEEFCPGSAHREKLGLPTETSLAIFVGDIKTSRKNLGTVLKAVQRVPRLHLAVVGSTEGSPFPNLARMLGIANRVHFLGFRRDVAELMRSADLFVFPSLYEPFGLVVLEALAVGLPVITAANVGAAGIVREGGGVVLEDGRDACALARAISELLTDRPRLQKMQFAARQSGEYHNWDGMAAKYFCEYEAVLKGAKYKKDGKVFKQPHSPAEKLN